MSCIVDPYSNKFHGKDFDKMATEYFGYFTLNDLSLNIAISSLCQMVTETKGRLGG